MKLLVATLSLTIAAVPLLLRPSQDPGPPAARPAAASPVAIAIHGGALSARRSDLPPERLEAAQRVLGEVIDEAHRRLEAGVAALDVVQWAVEQLEESPLFNAGRGAVRTSAGEFELDAAIMDGSGPRAGAVASVRGVKRPVRLARAVMERTPHVLLVGPGAEAFAREEGFDFVGPEWFAGEEARAEDAQGVEPAGDPEEDAGNGARAWRGALAPHDTVGAVALDRQGRLAAATSTGGIAGKRPGRVGDVPVIGAGTYADRRAAISATGQGEFFIRHVVAHDVVARMRFGGRTLEAAADEVVRGVLVEAGGLGGLVAVDAAGRVAMPYNSSGMFRAAIDAEGRRRVAIFTD